MLVVLFFLCVKCVNQLIMRQKCFLASLDMHLYLTEKFWCFECYFRKKNFLISFTVVDTFVLTRYLLLRKYLLKFRDAGGTEENMFVLFKGYYYRRRRNTLHHYKIKKMTANCRICIVFIKTSVRNCSTKCCRNGRKLLEN